MRFMLATGNRHKLGEFRAILAPHEVLPMPAGVELPPEGVESFAANARGKAQGAGAGGRRRDPALLGAARPAARTTTSSSSPTTPASRSRRWAGRRASPAPATRAWTGPAPTPPTCARLLRELAGFAGPLARRARFVCAVVAVAPRHDRIRGDGTLVGRHRRRRRAVKAGSATTPSSSPRGQTSLWPSGRRRTRTRPATAHWPGGPSSTLATEGLLHGTKAPDADAAGSTADDLDEPRAQVARRRRLHRLQLGADRLQAHRRHHLGLDRASSPRRCTPARDLVAAIIAFCSVRKAAKPPDLRHHYGHEKVENLSGVIEALLIIAAAGVIIYEGVQKIIDGPHIDHIWLGIGVMVVSGVVNLVVSRKVLYPVARRTRVGGARGRRRPPAHRRLHLVRRRRRPAAGQAHRLDVLRPHRRHRRGRAHHPARATGS